MSVWRGENKKICLLHIRVFIHRIHLHPFSHTHTHSLSLTHTHTRSFVCVDCNHCELRVTDDLIKAGGMKYGMSKGFVFKAGKHFGTAFAKLAQSPTEEPIHGVFGASLPFTVVTQ
jgi:hypothetical protein